MKKICLFIAVIMVAILFSLSLGCKHSTEPEESAKPDTTYGPVVRKPNIYLYPENTCFINIKIEFPKGGKIIQSEPLYSDGWNVKVNPDGKINDKYEFLFYEATCPEIYQYDSGWVVSKDSLSEFFSDNLTKAGFNNRERKDFLDYWTPKLVEYPYYLIYPQFSKEIEKVILLKFSILPNNILRLFYVIKGTDNINVKLLSPIIPEFKRNGFVVTEWGVILK